MEVSEIVFGTLFEVNFTVLLLYIGVTCRKLRIVISVSF